MAVLFALDRAGAADRSAELLSANDIVLLDRYVASNAAYNAARVHQGVDGEMVAWIRELELGRLALPAPDLQLYLDVPVALAEQRARSREARTRRVSSTPTSATAACRPEPVSSTSELAATNWVSPWWIVGPETDPADTGTQARGFRVIGHPGSRDSNFPAQ